MTRMRLAHCKMQNSVVFYGVHSRREPGRLHLALQDIEIAFEVMIFRLVCQLAQETERDTPRVLEL
jgi:hypothetical protein